MSEIEKVFDALDLDKKELTDKFFEITPKEILDEISEASLSYLVCFFMEDTDYYCGYITEMKKYFSVREVIDEYNKN